MQRSAHSWVTRSGIGLRKITMEATDRVSHRQKQLIGEVVQPELLFGRECFGLCFLLLAQTLPFNGKSRKSRRVHVGGEVHA